jgi:methylenetetrahydrofolate reductase (NADPH)
MDLLNLKSKVDSGADVVITQLYYDNQHYYQFLARCRALGITQPIIPGLMPILSFEQIKRITTMCGATIPAFLLKAMEQAGDNVSKIQEIGISHTANQALDLLRNGVPGIHFYVLNQHFHIAEIMDRIKSSLPEN